MKKLILALFAALLLAFTAGQSVAYAHPHHAYYGGLRSRHACRTISLARHPALRAECDACVVGHNHHRAFFPGNRLGERCVRVDYR